ncbi:hypothetical protein NDU88_005842 [Pleurodeles waltl]|uniref:Secreted protein n=1 Tax=Pleurodeles waltl TaxID=8319 RepID=A0AAV7MC67_PLEWA|nr:hypothetical protein NDU88_005842 [Pleurodeles waltl]
MHARVTTTMLVTLLAVMRVTVPAAIHVVLRAAIRVAVLAVMRDNACSHASGMDGAAARPFFSAQQTPLLRHSVLSSPPPSPYRQNLGQTAPTPAHRCSLHPQLVLPGK